MFLQNKIYKKIFIKITIPFQETKESQRVLEMYLCMNAECRMNPESPRQASR